MIVYIATFALTAALSLLAMRFAPGIAVGEDGARLKTGNKSLNRIFIFLLFVMLAFVAAFRYSVGTDFFSYYIASNWTNKFKLGNYSDQGFTLFAMACEWVFGGMRGSITIGAAIVTVALFVFTIARRSNNLVISALLFLLAGCYIGMFNGIRQYMAAAILFAGYRFVVEKKMFKWLIVVLIASTIHVTAILMFFVYFICNLRCNWWLVMLYAALAIALLLSYDSIFELLGGLKQTEFNAEDEYMMGDVNMLRVLIQCVPIVMFLFVKKSVINEDRECRFLFNISLLNAAFAIAAMNSPYFSRFWIYTSCFQILMYPKIFSKMIKDNKNIFTAALLVCYGVFWIYEILNSPSLREFHWIFNYL